MELRLGGIIIEPWASAFGKKARSASLCIIAATAATVRWLARWLAGMAGKVFEYYSNS